MSLARADREARRRLREHAGELSAVRVREAEIARAWCLLVCCVRNEMPRMPAFLDYYRRLGVAHFLVLDNESTDGLTEYLAAQPDCSVWRAAGSYKASNFGMDWCNHLLAMHGVGKWCVTVDPDEFLVYPYCEERGLASLTDHLDMIGQPSLFTVMVDAYGVGRLSQTRLEPGADPFALCPWFDRFNLTQRFNEELRSMWVQGGVRMRRFFAGAPHQAPALNKVPLVRWQAGWRYLSSTHHLNQPAANCTVLDNPEAVSGVLFHFKYVSLLQEKAAEELQRREHYAGSQEYRAYLDAGDVVLHDPQVSVRYAGSAQMQALGFMQCGTWF
ncbi:MAG: glycosyltransferase family 2 protein [Burkholderiales bacterium]|nr:glycosyltransferase family 2 protein [Burkholderiales bacterium]